MIVYPNGGQTLFTDQTHDIKWRVYGDGISSVDIYYSVSSDSNLNAVAEGFWTGINWRGYSSKCTYGFRS